MDHPENRPSSERDRPVTLLCHVMLQVWFLSLSQETGTVIIIMGVNFAGVIFGYPVNRIYGGRRPCGIERASKIKGKREQPSVA